LPFLFAAFIEFGSAVDSPLIRQDSFESLKAEMSAGYRCLKRTWSRGASLAQRLGAKRC